MYLVIIFELVNHSQTVKKCWNIKLWVIPEIKLRYIFTNLITKCIHISGLIS